MTLSEKAAYIRGLAEGLDLDEDKKEVRVIKEMLELLAEMAADVEEMDSDISDLYDAVEKLDEDLVLVEDEVFGDMDEDYEEELYEITCPNCGEAVHVDEDMLLCGDVVCSACGEKIEIEIDACDCCEEE